VYLTLLVALAILLSGCLHSGSTEELNLQDMSQEELESRADDLQQGAVEHPHFLDGGNTTIVFEDVGKIKADYIQIRADYMTIDMGLSIDGSVHNGTPGGDNEQIKYYSTEKNVQREHIRVRTENQTYTVQNVTPTPGETYNVSLPNRSRWRYQSYLSEGREIALSQIGSVEARSDDDLAVHLNPSKELVTEYINKQYNSLVGKRELNLSPSNFESANATLLLEVERNKAGQITLTTNGMSGLNVSLEGDNKGVNSDFVVTAKIINW